MDYFTIARCYLETRATIARLERAEPDSQHLPLLRGCLQAFAIEVFKAGLSRGDATLPEPGERRR